METRANHLLIGSFVLIVVVATLGFIIWVAQIRIDQPRVYYQIQFDEAVTGLATGGTVRFSGIQVGVVQSIHLDEQRPGQVTVVVAVDPATPVRQDSMASLELQGITGTSFVQISGGSTQAPLMPGGTLGQPLPQIPARMSFIASVFSGAPELVRNATDLLGNTNKLLDEGTRDDLRQIVADIRKITDAFARNAGQIDTFAENLGAISTDTRATLEEARATFANLNRVAANADVAMRQDVRPMLTSARQTVDKLNLLSGQLNELVAENREPMNTFVAEGLPDLRNLINESRQMVDNVNRVAETLEDGPGQFLFGMREQGFRPGE